jgi:hypothetical protein
LGQFWISHRLAEALHHQIFGFTTEYSPGHVMGELLLEIAAELYPLNKHIFGRAGATYLNMLSERNFRLLEWYGAEKYR